ncbi:unnamed protein product [Linum trigynum]|uniref:Uncharacterized protein n=1 Tax=Linum trigynum TaxID=586398 RepID=A0AAV2DZ94_9ROSI
MEISNLRHGRFSWALQNSKSLAYRTTTPADEHAAASDNIAVTCRIPALSLCTAAKTDAIGRKKAYNVFN